jgi:hypothetical protein
MVRRENQPIEYQWSRAAALQAAGVPVTFYMPPHFPPGRSLSVTVRDGSALAQNGQSLARGAHGDDRVALNGGTTMFTR